MTARPPLVLASTSPQRRALLAQLGAPFRVVAPAYEEAPLPGSHVEVVCERSRGKARSVAQEPGDGPVVGVDTEVSLGTGKVLGKPADAAEAAAMLRVLAGREHVVLGGLTVRDGERERTSHARTVVRFRALDDAEVDAYVASGEWRGRAGGYAIQGVGAALVERVDGCYANVVGLPVALLVDELRALGWRLLG